LGAFGRLTLGRAARAVLLLWSAATIAAAGWAVSQNPFASAMVARSAEDAAAALDRAVARTVDAEWLTPRLEAAVAAGDPDEADVLLRLGDAHGVAVPDDIRAAAEAVGDRGRGLAACGTCALDSGACADLAQLAVCNLSVEMTTLGDLNALRRGLGDHMAGTPVDRVDVGLGLLGLGATGAIVVSGGTGAGVKVGASFLRLARRADLLSPGLRASVDDAVRGAVRWNEAGRAVRGEVAPAALLDTARTARAGAIARDAARLAWNTSPADGLALMRLADDPAELAGLARLSDAAGAATRPGVRAIGKARALRTLARVSDLALAAVGLLALAAAQIGALLAMLLRRALRAR